MGYTRNALKGISWVGFLRIFLRTISFLRIALIARILIPSQFGVFAIATLVLGFVETITETGINIFLIQQKDDIKKYLDSAWVVSIARGIIIFVIILLSSPLIALYFKKPEALNIILLVSLVPLIRGFINPAVVTFQKDLTFHKDLFYKGSIYLVEAAVSVIFVYIFKTPASLVWGLIIGAIFEVFLSHLVLSIRPRFKYNMLQVKEIVSKGRWVTLSGIFDYSFYNGDNLVVGRVLGTGALGIYDMAYKISLLPITEISETVSRVIFPVFTKFSDDSGRLIRAYIRVTIVISALSIPFGLLIIFFSSEIIALALGPNWSSAVPVLQVLAVFGIIRSVTNPCGAVFLTLGKQKYITLITFTGAISLFILILPFISLFGLIGAGLAAVVASLIQIPIIILLLFKAFRK